jgi:outer membrane protein assembly factor BamD
MSAFAYYKDEKYDDAIIAADRFLKYHPGNKDAAYALYLKGICYYDQITASDKDQGDTQKAEEAFQYLITLFPNTPYAEDARNKINLTEDYKAGQEMVVGRFYLNEGNYLSALNRFNVVLEEYQTTIQIEEALYREVEIYAILGMNQYADGYYKILLKNYPEGKWTAKAAKVMERIGVNDAYPQAEASTVVESKVTESESWYSRWKQKKVEDQKIIEDSNPVVESESKSWFSGWFGGSDEEVAAVETPKVEAPVETVIEEENRIVIAPKEESKTWFSNWFGGKSAQ